LQEGIVQRGKPGPFFRTIRQLGDHASVADFVEKLSSTASPDYYERQHAR
jgi:hypothetical protein